MTFVVTADTCAVYAALVFCLCNRISVDVRFQKDSFSKKKNLNLCLNWKFDRIEIWKINLCTAGNLLSTQNYVSIK